MDTKEVEVVAIRVAVAVVAVTKEVEEVVVEAIKGEGEVVVIKYNRQHIQYLSFQ